MHIAQEQRRRSVMSARRMGIVLALGALLSLAVVGVALATHERPKGATPDRDALVVAYESCPSGPPGGPINASHEILSLPSCVPPAQDSDFLTVGTFESNGAPAKSQGYLRKSVIMGIPGPPEDSDIGLELSLTDVRCRTALATATPAVCSNPNTGTAGDDYSGEINARLEVARITDHANGGSGTPATTGFIVQQVPVPCAPTGPPDDPTVGSTCAISTTLEAVTGDPSAVIEGERQNWEFFPARVLDGGSDGDVDTPGDGEDVFVADGIFIP
jgi:hypothetical protein